MVVFGVSVHELTQLWEFMAQPLGMTEKLPRRLPRYTGVHFQGLPPEEAAPPRQMTEMSFPWSIAGRVRTGRLLPFDPTCIDLRSAINRGDGVGSRVGGVGNDIPGVLVTGGLIRSRCQFVLRDDVWGVGSGEVF
jgi:hypothetical protein